MEGSCVVASREEGAGPLDAEGGDAVVVRF